MLQYEDAMIVPGFSVVKVQSTLGAAYTVLVSGPSGDSPCAVKSHRATWNGNFDPSGWKNTSIHRMWCGVVFGWVISLPTLTVTGTAAPFFTESGASMTGTCFSFFQSADWYRSFISVIFTL